MLKCLQRVSLKKRNTAQKEKGSWEKKQKPQAKWKEEKEVAASTPEKEIGECVLALAAELKAKDPLCSPFQKDLCVS